MTATSRFTVDTNILIYAVDRSDQAKHMIAEKIVRILIARRAKLPLQCLNEFYRATTRKRLLQPVEAEMIVRKYMLFTDIEAATPEDLLQAMSLHQQDNLQFFDSLLICSAIRTGCTILFSEDFQNGRTFGSLTVHNPFTMEDAELHLLLS
ncbi:PIN domain-containing protein [Granulicella mallensis]|uniref:PilT protein domain protein n=1 Tax=Granulicella mallensis (strain ATCC BAA-1857 / DSM 23137 / MP5ACTX8) TaxID=682795 RepID=G8P0J3_GRAMM|nr:PIN domain-containing protein [Granulicella mallensis]AEU38081.1 PilT protein domain protein [Granulicella mallensis MP5ACTX8]